MKRISLNDLLHPYRDIPYEQQHRQICSLISEGRIKPLKASGTNGKRPALYREYWLIEQKKDYRLLEEELKYSLHPRIDIDYYLSRPENYEKDRPWVLMLSDYLKQNKDMLNCRESVNERSFEIWRQEKFLSRGQGKRILKNCGLTEEFLHIYQTTEPLAYYSHTRQVPQNILILENKDTFYSMRRHLMNENGSILGTEFKTLIYGAGKGILRTFLDFELCAEPYMRDKRNKICYFGDLDYEGIGIYENLAKMIPTKWTVTPFVQAYETMLKKADETCRTEELPDTKEQQNRNISGEFFTYFDKKAEARMKEILEAGKYIPQEILNIADF